MYLPAQSGALQSRSAESLRRDVTSDAKKKSAIRVTLLATGQQATSYHIYRGGRYLGLSLPKEHATRGQVVRAEIAPLTGYEFVRSLRPFELRNPDGSKWFADVVSFKRAELAGDDLNLFFEQTSSQSDVASFQLKTRALKFPGISNRYGGVHLEFGVVDYIQRLFRFRIRDNGYTLPTLQYPAGGKFKSVWMVSFDGFRLHVLYGPNRSASTIYLRPPDHEIYEVGELNRYDGELTKLARGKFSRAYVADVRILGSTELSVFSHPSTYQCGRLGAEVSYLISTSKLGLRDVVIEEPASGGRDLHTKDGAVSIQSRLLNEVAPEILAPAAQIEMYKLVSKVKQDFLFNETMKRGFAILSLKSGRRSLQSVVVEVRRM